MHRGRFEVQSHNNNLRGYIYPSHLCDFHYTAQRDPITLSWIWQLYLALALIEGGLS